MIKLLLNPPNLLLMDEPTTHLDMSGIDALIAALNQFSGTLIFISHDVHFIRSIAEHVVHVEHGKLRSYHGNYDYYLSKQAEEESRLNGATQSKGKVQTVSRGVTAVNKTISSKERRRIEAEERNKRSAKLRKYKSKVDAIEKEITSLEEKQSALTVELEQPATYQNGPRIVEINQELKMISDLLESRSSEWEVAQQELESHQS